MPEGAKTESSRYIPELDGLRGLAILMVLLWHFVFGRFAGANSPIEEGSLLSYLVAPGLLTWSGVDLFFVLSGFLIGGILLDARESPNYFKAFYMRRFWRIVPIYAVVVALFFLVVALGVDFLTPMQPDPIPWYSYVTFTQNFWMAAEGLGIGNFLNITWSLAIEEQFYLTLPFLIRYVKQPYLTYLLIGLVFAAIAVRLLLYFLTSGSWVTIYVLMPARADALMLGVLGALMVRNFAVRGFLLANRGLCLAFLAVASVGVGVFAFNGWLFFSPQMMTFGYTLLAVFYLSILLFAVLHNDGILGRIMRNRALMWLGSIAYGTYLLHILAIFISGWLLRNFLVGEFIAETFGLTAYTVVMILLSLTLTLTVASISWKYFEQPMTKIGKRFKY